MMKSAGRYIVVAFWMALGQAEGAVTVPGVISSHMVLQRDRPLPIWGWADAGEEVTVEFGGMTAKGKADEQGSWRVVLPVMKADRTGRRMIIRGKNTIQLDDILVGEVWVASGQSNMEKPLGPAIGQTPCNDWKEEVAAANFPQIRLLEMRPRDAEEPASDADCDWLPCSPQNIMVQRGRGAGYSACAYFFARKLHRELKVPIGMIAASIGGTRCESWTPGRDGRLFNGMIAPVTPMAIRGAIWYQGESNVGDGLRYASRMQALIEGWRKAWGYEIPFYFVQIAPFSGYSSGSLPMLWEAQVNNLKIPKTGMVVTTDLVPAISDIHPVNKIDVGERLALWALAKVYKTDVVFSGPIYKSMEVEGGKIRLSFAHVWGGLKSRDSNPLVEFEIAGADGKFVTAKATIEGDTVVVQSREVPVPVNARFGWSNEAYPNLVNKEGLPASPFQTKDWQGGTGE
ncbi:MAG: sialate O-acetylesterase [Roseibacillus sp.]|nr:sialate O-acetylesterase [Roseibacillus sp.]